LAGSSTFTFPGWATEIRPGPAAELAQVLTFVLTSDNPGLFESGPAVDPATGSLSFGLPALVSGLAHVTLVLQDDGGTEAGGQDTSDPQTFQIKVTRTNSPPIARDDTATTIAASPITFNVLANDSDAEGDTFVVLSAYLPAPIHGQLTLTPTGDATYAPDPGFTGMISFEYSISDGYPGGTNYAIVRITVGPAPASCLAALWPLDRTLSFPGESALFVLTLDGQEGCAVLSNEDESGGGGPLQAAWSWDETNHLSSAWLTNCFEPGCHALTLTLITLDGQTCRSDFDLCVISPIEAVQHCLNFLEQSPVDRKTKRPLAASLKSAAASFEREAFIAGLNQLSAFENKVRAQLLYRWPSQAQALLDSTRRLRTALADALP
jgi:hypothetical protein